MDLYKTLGIEKTSTKEDVRKAYKKLAVKYHPDRNKGDDEICNKFKDISSAYETLYDDSKRKVYDLTGSVDNTSTISENEAFDLFNSLFNSFGNPTNNLFGSSSLGDLFSNLGCDDNSMPPGIKFTVHTFGSLPNMDTFNFAKDNDNPKLSSKRHSKNRHQEITERPDDTIYNCTVSLEDIFNNEIKTLNVSRDRFYGKNKQVDSKSFKISLYEKNIILKSEGDEIYGCKERGDILINLHDKPHDIYKRVNSCDLIIEKQISLYEYYAGTSFTIKDLNNKIIKLKINKNDMLQTHDNILKLYGEGLPHKSGARGDLFIKIKLTLPNLNGKDIRKIGKYFKPEIEENNLDDNELLELVICKSEDLFL